MDEVWVMVFMGVVLKIPVGMMLYTVWWAIKAAPEPESAEGGTDDGHGFRRRMRPPKRPQGPRRGPHAPDTLPLPDCPPAGRTRPAGRPAPLPRVGEHAGAATERALRES